MDNKKLVFLKQLSTFVEDRSLWVEPNRKYDFRLSPNPPFSIFVVVLDNLFDYQLFVENSHENGQRIRKCGTVW